MTSLEKKVPLRPRLSQPIQAKWRHLVESNVELPKKLQAVPAKSSQRSIRSAQLVNILFRHPIEIFNMILVPKKSLKASEKTKQPTKYLKFITSTQKIVNIWL